MDRRVTTEGEVVRDLADRLGLGLLQRDGEQWAAGNGAMAALLVEFEPNAFTQGGDAVRARDRTGRWRRFHTWALDAAWLVQEIGGPRAATVAIPAARFFPQLQVDDHGRVVEANAAAGELIEYFAADEAIGDALAGARRAGERSFDLPAGGRLFEFAVQPHARGHFLFGREVTERRHAEAQLRQDEARLRALLGAAPDAIVTVADDGTIDYISPRGERLFGYPEGTLRASAVERLIPEWFHAPPVVAVLAQRADPCGAHPVSGLHGVHADGSRFPVELSASALDREGRLYVTAIVRDVTEREAAAREIRELNHHLQRHVERLTALNAELEAFSYSVSHDLRGPLRSIDGFSGLLLEEYGADFDPEARRYVERVRAAAARMADLIDGLLRLAQITRTELRREPVDLSAIARFAADGLQRETPSRAAEFTIADDVIVDGDRTLLTVALENLLSNAWKFTVDRQPARIAFAVEREPGRIVYCVRDNGVGFDMAFARKLFLPFERLHEGGRFPGTGIGLATVQRVIQRHGGALWATSREGEGATFCFTLSPGERSTVTNGA